MLRSRKERLRSNKIEIQEFHSNNGIPGDFIIVQMCLTKGEFISLQDSININAELPEVIVGKDIAAYMNNAVSKANLDI